MACDCKGNQFEPNESTGCPTKLVCEGLLEIETDVNILDLYNEVVLRDGSYVRASPNYRGEGPWFDFVNIQWEDDNGEPYFLPARCLAFYRKNNDCMVLLQSVDIKSDGKVAGCRNSVLTSHFKMQYSRNGVPVLYCVNCASIDSTLLCFDLQMENQAIDETKKSLMVVRPRNEWAYAWYVWNKLLRDKNANRSITRPMVDLGNEEMIIKVRREITRCIKDHGKT